LGTNIKKELLRFISEDIQGGDITSVLLPKKKIKAKIISRQEGVLAGVKFAGDIFRLKGCNVKIIKKDGAKLKSNQMILQISGNAGTVLSCERTALNLLSRMSGIATHTNLLVSKIRKINKKTSLYSTRKTAPGLRYFDKEAVKIGGGHKHRMALDDMVMIKDNHIDFAGSISNAIQKTKKYLSDNNKDLEIIVEARNLDEVQEIINEGGVKRILLDNFDYETTKKAVAIIGGKCQSESSGGITEDTITEYAKCGVDFISVGALTHSVLNFDLSLKAI